ncbi:MAG: hypothetical protein AAB430_03285 [Patescibacteria group bacterium]
MILADCKELMVVDVVPAGEIQVGQPILPVRVFRDICSHASPVILAVLNSQAMGLKGNDGGGGWTTTDTLTIVGGVLAAIGLLVYTRWHYSRYEEQVANYDAQDVLGALNNNELCGKYALPGVSNAANQVGAGDFAAVVAETKNSVLVVGGQADSNSKVVPGTEFKGVMRKNSFWHPNQE